MRFSIILKILLFLLWGTILWAQNYTIDSYTIGSSGVVGNRLSATLGETMVTPTQNNNYQLFAIGFWPYVSHVLPIEDIEDLMSPKVYELQQNYPNPFNSVTVIRFSIKEDQHTTLCIYNTVGQHINVLINEFLEAGYHDVQFDASTLPSGIYFYRIQAGIFSQVRKMVLLR